MPPGKTDGSLIHSRESDSGPPSPSSRLFMLIPQPCAVPGRHLALHVLFPPPFFYTGELLLNLQGPTPPTRSHPTPSPLNADSAFHHGAGTSWIFISQSLWQLRRTQASPGGGDPWQVCPPHKRASREGTPLHPAYGSRPGTDASECWADSACDCPTHLSVSRLPPPPLIPTDADVGGLPSGGHCKGSCATSEAARHQRCAVHRAGG